MTAAQLGAFFIGGVAGYFAVSALIDRGRRKTESAPDGIAKPRAVPSPDAPAASETPKPARSVWEEMNGGGRAGDGHQT
jgi:hypothetical protein